MVVEHRLHLSFQTSIKCVKRPGGIAISPRLLIVVIHLLLLVSSPLDTAKLIHQERHFTIVFRENIIHVIAQTVTPQIINRDLRPVKMFVKFPVVINLFLQQGRILFIAMDRPYIGLDMDGSAGIVDRTGRIELFGQVVNIGQ